MNGTKSIAALAVFLSVGLAHHVSAAENSEVARANALYANGSFQEALDAYSRLAEERPESAELQFNRGAAEFQVGNIDGAREAFEEASVLSDDPEIQALCSYNMGNCTFNEAQQQLEMDPEAAMATLNQSIRYYKDALARNRDLSDAAHNMETAKRVIQQLRQQQQQQQQEQQQQQNEMKEKLDELIEEQQQQSEQSQQAADQQKDPSQSPPSDSQMKQMADDQQQTREKTEELSQEMQSEADGDQPEPMDEAKAHTEEAAKKQEEAEEHLKNQKPDEANKAQEEALEELKQARDALGSGEESEDQQAQDGKQGDPQDGGGDQQQPQSEQTPSDSQEEQQAQNQQTPEEMENVPPPDATARDILNQEMRNKEERQLQQMIRVRPVDKDW